MNAFPEVRLDALVTLAAGFGDVEVVDRRLIVPGREDPVRRPVGRVAVVAAGGNVDSAFGGLPVDRSGVDPDGVVDEDVVLGGDVEVLVALAAGLRKIGRMGGGALGARRQDVVIAITSGVRDMQGVLDLIWEQLLPAFCPVSLPPNPGAAERLRRKLGLDRDQLGERVGVTGKTVAAWEADGVPASSRGDRAAATRFTGRKTGNSQARYSARAVPVRTSGPSKAGQVALAALPPW